MRWLLPTIALALVAAACSGGTAAAPQTTPNDPIPLEPTTTTSTTTTTTTLPPRPEVDETITLTIDGVDREYDLFAPAGLPHEPVPLVVDLHGLGSTPPLQDVLSGMRAKAAAEGFVVAQPAARFRTWDVLADRDVDVPFLRAVVADVDERIGLDADRVFITGMSNGGGMAHRAACEAPDVFAAAAPVAGAYVQADVCSPQRPVPILAFHGTEDFVVPFTGVAELFPAIETWIRGWAERNGCTSPSEEGRLADDVRTLTWVDCTADVRLVIVEAGGHGWPGTGDVSRLTRSTTSISATELMWEFFVDHPRP